MPNQEIINYINQSLAAGLTRDQIRQNLLRAGWDEMSVSEALNSGQGDVSSGVQVYPSANFKNTKIGIYLMSFFVILLIHAGLYVFSYYIAPIVTAVSLFIISLGFFIVCLFFYEIYKRYKSHSFVKYCLIFLVILLGVIFLLKFRYIPSVKITVTDVFGKPLENISIYIQDYIGENCSVGGCNNAYNIPLRSYYITNKNGQVTTDTRFSFKRLGQRKAFFTYFVINEPFINHYNFFGSPTEINKRNNSFDGRTIEVYDERNIQVVLASSNPGGSGYRECDLAINEDAKNECLVYSLLYSAIKEKNSELCKMYDNEGVKKALAQDHYFYLGREGEIKNGCLTLVGGVLENNPQICEEVIDGPFGEYNKYCKVIVSEWENNEEECTTSMEDECKKTRLEVLNNTNAALCAGKTQRDNGGIEYLSVIINTPISRLGEVLSLYRTMFCK